MEAENEVSSAEELFPICKRPDSGFTTIASVANFDQHTFSFTSGRGDGGGYGTYYCGGTPHTTTLAAQRACEEG
jgi:hypothetical protein